MSITFNNTYLSGITGQTSAFQTTFTNLVNAVEGFFVQQFTDSVTLNVSFDWQPLNASYPGPPAGFTLGSNSFSLNEVSYSDIVNALTGHQSTNDSDPGDDAATVAALPGSDPKVATGSNDAKWLVTNGQEKLLGFNGVGANDNLGADATITLASDLPNGTSFDFDRSDGIGANAFDAFGVLAHEITEGLFGRIMRGGTVATGKTTNRYTIMDLFHYTPGGSLAVQETGANNLLSFDGQTGDPNINRPLDNSGDIADPSSAADPRSSFADGRTGVIQEITQSWLRVLDALGWTRANNLDDHNQSNTASTTVLNAGASISGSLELQGDHDWFKVVLDGSKNYAVVIEGAATGAGTLADPFAALYGGASPSRENGAPGESADDGGVGANSLLLTAFGDSGTFFVDVGSIGTAPEDSIPGKVQDLGKGTYKVSLIEDDFRQDSNTSGAVAVGGSTGGNIQFANDHDWLKINMTVGENYAIIVTGNAGGLPDPQIQLRSPTGAVLGTIHNPSSNDNADFGSGVTLNSRVLWSRGIDDSLTSPATDAYFLDVFAHNGTDTGAYTVSVVKDDFRGDQFGNEGTAIAGGGPVAGNIDFATDRDWFKIAMSVGKNYAIIVNGNTLADPTIRLFDPNGTALAQIHNNPANNDADFGSGVTPNSRILWSRGIDDTLTSPVTDTYFLDVRSNVGTATGSYSVSVVEDDFRGDQFGNEGSATAGGGPVAGNIDFATDHDWFKIAMSVGKNYAIIVHGNTLADPTIKLYDPAGAALAQIHNNPANNDADFGGGTPLDSRILWSRGIDDTLTSPVTDTYFLDVSSNIGPATGSYAVTVVEDDFRGDQFGNNGLLTVGSLAGSAGKIDFETDHDWFSVHLDAGTTYAVQVRGADTGHGTLPNPDLALRAADGSAVVGGTLLHDVTATNHDARLLIAPVATADYFVDASSQVGADTGTYNARALLASQLAKVNDFNGDGISDVFWRQSSGADLFWEIQNFARTTTDLLPSQATTWRVAATGDFDGDLTSDILWQSSKGQLQEWHIVNGAVSGSPIDLGSIASGLTVMGTGDFYKDGRSAVLLQSSKGEVLTWETNPDGSFKAAMDSHGFVPNNDRIIGTGDFNGDGRAEILWSGPGGQLFKSDAVGATLGLSSLGSLSPSWQIVGTGDFFGDGKQEAVASQAGDYKLVDLNGGPLLGATITTQSSKWQLVEIGDFNGDDKYDLMFRTGSGDNKFVEANGAEHPLDSMAANWNVQHQSFMPSA